MSIPEKIEHRHQHLRSRWVDYHYEANAALERFARLGYGTLPVCMAKTQASLSDDKTKLGRPRGWRLTCGRYGCRRAGHGDPSLWLDNDHARSAGSSGCREHRPRQRRDRGVVLMSGLGAGPRRDRHRRARLRALLAGDLLEKTGERFARPAGAAPRPWRGRWGRPPQHGANLTVGMPSTPLPTRDGQARARAAQLRAQLEELVTLDAQAMRRWRPP